MRVDAQGRRAARVVIRPLPCPCDVPDVNEDGRSNSRKLFTHGSPANVFRKAGCGGRPQGRERPNLGSPAFYLQIDGFWSGGARSPTQDARIFRSLPPPTPAPAPEAFAAV